jgi:hypothetical protein
MKSNDFQTNLYFILPSDILLLSVQMLGSHLGLVLVEEGD